MKNAINPNIFSYFITEDENKRVDRDAVFCFNVNTRADGLYSQAFFYAYARDNRFEFYVEDEENAVAVGYMVIPRDNGTVEAILLEARDIKENGDMGHSRPSLEATSISREAAEAIHAMVDEIMVLATPQMIAYYA